MSNAANKKNNTSVTASGGVKLDRKTVERNRRIHMKGLCFNLISLIPLHHFKPSKELLSQQDQLDQAASYIKKLKERVDELKVKKEVLALMSINGGSNNIVNTTCTINNPMITSPTLITQPVIELKEMGSILEVILISGSSQQTFRLNEVIKVLQEEGTNVVSTSFSNTGDRVFLTLHSQVKVSRVGVDATRIYERLQQLMHFTSF